jgi:DNA-binding winged helix-turn-helix (wHTH) protein
MQFRFADCLIDTDRRQILRNGDNVRLSPKAYQLLLRLIDARPNAVAREQLASHLWPSTFVVPANLPNLVGEIRAALGDSPSRPRIIRTLQRFGYAFSCDVEVIQPGSDAANDPGSHWLEWNGQPLLLQAGETVIGRDPTADVRLDGLGVSRRHARLLVRPDRVIIEDLSSKNGTFVEGERIHSPRVLVPGDTLRFGSVLVTFHVAAPGPATQTIGGPGDT